MSQRSQTFKASDDEWMIEAYKKVENIVNTKNTQSKRSGVSQEVNVEEFSALLKKEEAESKDKNKKWVFQPIWLYVC